MFGCVSSLRASIYMTTSFTGTYPVPHRPRRRTRCLLSSPAATECIAILGTSVASRHAAIQHSSTSALARNRPSPNPATTTAPRPPTAPHPAIAPTPNA